LADLAQHQVLAEAQLRLTVAGEIPRNSAVFSIDKPPKYRNSTTWLCYRSSAAGLFSASS